MLSVSSLRHKIGLLIVLALLLSLLGPNASPSSAAPPNDSPPHTQTNFTVGEGLDFATRILRDPWDMSEFSDISQWLNKSGVEHYLLDIRVENGLFSARTSSAVSNFFALFSGYPPGVRAGKIGRLHPIPSAAFGCFYMAMNAQAATPTGYQFTWADEHLPFLVYGTNYNLPLNNGVWTLYHVNLHTWPYYVGTPWWGRSQWQSLMIVPVLAANATFTIDWIRLTDCQPVYVNLSGLPQGEYALWVGAGSPERQILVSPSFSPQADGTFAWDVQGLAAGAYTYYVKTPDGSSIVQQGQLNIVQTPIVNFIRPSAFSGPDYATGQRNPWSLDPTDITNLLCVNYAFLDGILDLHTLPPSSLPGYCVGPGAGEADPRLFMNTPDHGNLSAFRYFSFSAYINGAWSSPELGMIVRLFWRLDRPGEDCYYGSHAIPLDVGWHTYWVDLYDPFNGRPEDITPGDCPIVNWRDQAQVGPLVGFRFDPNENITGETMHQQIDWIRLTRPDQVLQGQPFEVGLLLNKPAADLTSLYLYYTNDLRNPTQHPASPYTPPAFRGLFQNFLPLALSSSPNTPLLPLPAADLTFAWDTRSVAPGEYHLCAVADDGYSQALFCSETVVQVLAP